MSFCKVTIIGRLGGDPESRELQNGSVLNFSMAANGRKKDTTVWFRVSAFGEVAERLSGMVERGYVKKGSLLYVEGQLDSREYQANGQNRTSLDVTMTDWRFVGGGDKQGGNQASGQFGDYRSDYRQLEDTAAPF